MTSSVLLIVGLAGAVSVVGAEPPAGVFDVISLGARGDGKILDTAALLLAFERASAWASSSGKNGIVLLRTGHTFLSGPLNLTAHTSLKIEGGATLRFSGDRALYPLIVDPYDGALRRSPLLGGYMAVDAVVEGGGTIDGNGRAWWPRKPSGLQPQGPADIPPYLCVCARCDRLRMSDVTFKDGPFVNL
jgi:polygalacturonase